MSQEMSLSNLFPQGSGMPPIPREEGLKRMKMPGGMKDTKTLNQQEQITKELTETKGIPGTEMAPGEVLGLKEMDTSPPTSLTQKQLSTTCK